MRTRLFSLALLVLVPRPSAQGFPLGDVHGLDQAVTAFALRPDGRVAVFLADRAVDDTFELFAVVPLQGSPFRLSGPMTPGGDVVEFAFGPGGKRVVYRADQDTDEVFELYSADGVSEALKISGPLAPGGDVEPGFRFSSEGRVVYRADQDLDGRLELYSARLGGGPAARLNGSLPVGGDVLAFDVSEDGRRVVYRADQDSDEVYELYSVLVEGGPPVRLHPPLVEDDAWFFQISPDSRRVVFSVHRTASAQFDLLSVPSDGGLPVQLDEPEVRGILSLRFTPDSAHVVYTAQTGPFDYDVRSVPTAGGRSTRLSGALIGAGLVDLSPDGRWAVLSAEGRLHSVPVDGSAAPLPLGDPADQVLLAAVSPDSRWAVYRSQPAPLEAWDLFSAALDGTRPAVRLNAPYLEPGAGVSDAVVSPDSRSVLYRSTRPYPSHTELLQVAVEGGPSRRVNAQLAPGGDVTTAAQIGGPYVLYLADQDQDEVFDLYLSFLARPHRPTERP